ncbi:MAG: hypothetical protein V8T53_11805, partial [Eubacteriales bacterium]
ARKSDFQTRKPGFRFPIPCPKQKDGFRRPFLLLIRLDKSDPLKPARGGLERVCAQVSEEV